MEKATKFLKGSNPNQALPSMAFFLSAAIIIIAYLPILAPILDSRLSFAFADFTTMAGKDSGQLRDIATYQTFSDGGNQIQDYRMFLLFSINLVTAKLGLTDSQMQSLIVLFCLIAGLLGIYSLSGMFLQEGRSRALAILALSAFYFLNLWGVERLIHLWIWFSYAIFPAFLAVGMNYVRKNSQFLLACYSLLFGFFGVIPHNFIYLLIFHAFVSTYLAYKGGIRKSLGFIITPILLYVLLNLPLLLALLEVKGGYPGDVSGSTLDYLSQYGGLGNLFTFTNNWWPSVPDSLLSNPIFRLSGIGIFASVLLLLLISRLNKEDGFLVAASLLLVAGAIFVAQGLNNPAMAAIIHWMGGANLSVLLGPFREWERICLLIPPLLCLMILAGLAGLGQGARFGVLAALAIFIAMNLIFSPVWAYLGTVYSAVQVPAADIQLVALGNSTHKALGITPLQYQPIFGNARFAWNTDKSVGAIYYEQYSYYAPTAPLINYMAEKEAPPALLDSLDIGTVILRTDFLNGTRFPAHYGWMDCRKNYITICFNTENTSAFGIYDGSILTSPEPQRFYSLAYLPQSRYAPTTLPDASTKYVVVDPELNRSLLGTEQELYVADSYLDFNWNSSPGVSSDQRGLSFSADAMINSTIDAQHAGTYFLGLRGSGSFNLTLDGNEVLFNSSRGSMEISGPVNISEGENILELGASNGSYLDILWLFPAEGDAAGYVDDNSPPPATIINSTRLSQTEADVTVNAGRPFLLSFAESYDSGWEADVYKDGQLQETVKPIPLYGTMDGFWINETGTMDVKVEYGPQRTFEFGLAVSGLTLAGLVCFLAFSFWRERHG